MHRVHARIIGYKWGTCRQVSWGSCPGCAAADDCSWCCCWKASFTSFLHQEIPTTSLIPVRRSRSRQACSQLKQFRSNILVFFFPFSRTRRKMLCAQISSPIPHFYPVALFSPPFGYMFDATHEAVTEAPMHVPPSGRAYGVPLCVN